MPLFRSPQQLKILGQIFVHAGRSFSIPELVRDTGVSQPTVWREIQRLEEAGLVWVRSVGRNKMIEANQNSPYFPELHGLANKLLGPKVLLEQALTEVEGVDEAFIFGSWAKRYHGELGPAPNDIDILVVGDADPDAVEEALAEAQGPLHAEINSVVVSRDEWERAATGFLQQLKSEELVPIVEHHAP
jgi:hypothetical protein